MEIREASCKQDADYIRCVRTATLNSLGVTPHPNLVEPVPVAKYLVAYDNAQPVGLAESALLGDIYENYEDSPNHAVCNLNAYCPLDEMATIRTVYAEPRLRGTSSLFLSLTLASAKLFHDLGARFATATTSISADGLRRLYLKYGGEIAGEGTIGGVETTLFVFELEYLLRHRAFKRVSRCFTFDVRHESKSSTYGVASRLQKPDLHSTRC